MVQERGGFGESGLNGLDESAKHHRNQLIIQLTISIKPTSFKYVFMLPAIPFIIQIIMQRNDKLRSQSTKRTLIQTNLPSLKSSVLMNKAMFTLSKVDIDSKAIQRQQKQRVMKTTTAPFDKDYQRSQSGFAMRKGKQSSLSPTEVKGQMKSQFDLPSSSFKLQLKDIKQQLDSISTIQPLVIDKSKISSKSYGIIKGYSANSHSGPALNYNEDRICIVTNLTKTSNKQKQISFFGVYDGNGGILKADFLRDNFHLFLVEDLAIAADMESAMRKTLQRLGQIFNEDYRFREDESTVSFVIVVIANQEIFYLQCGVCRSVISQSLGSNIFYPSKIETALLTKESSRKSKSIAQISRNKRPMRELGQVQCRQFTVKDNIDFILLGSKCDGHSEARECSKIYESRRQGVNFGFSCSTLRNKLFISLWDKPITHSQHLSSLAQVAKMHPQQSQDLRMPAKFWSHKRRKIRSVCHIWGNDAVAPRFQSMIITVIQIEMRLIQDILFTLIKMQQDYYMFSHSNRFTGSLTGQSQYNNRYGQPFEMNTSTQHRQFHQMKAQMPSDVLQLFKANEISFLKAPVKPKCRPLDPVTTTCSDINSMFDIPNENLMEKEHGETREEKKVRIAEERKERNLHRIDVEMQEWNPFADANVTSDPQKTLVVARLSYKTTEKTLKYEFEKYGIIKTVRVIRDQQGKSRGYAFIEFDNKDDFATAYKSANYRKIDGHKITVDFEKGRTLLRWRPRRFGGGKGYLRLTKEEVAILEKEETLRRNRHIMEEEERDRERSHSATRRHFDDREKDKKRKSSRQKKDKKEKKEKKQKHRHREDGYM